MLDKIELFVRRGRPKVLPVIGKIVGFPLAIVIGEAHRTFLAERGIGQHVIESLTAGRNQGIIGRYRHPTIDLADIVQEHIHQAEAARIGDNLVAVEGVVFQKSLLILVKLVVIRVGDEVIRG